MIRPWDRQQIWRLVASQHLSEGSKFESLKICSVVDKMLVLSAHLGLEMDYILYGFIGSKNFCLQGGSGIRFSIRAPMGMGQLRGRK